MKATKQLSCTYIDQSRDFFTSEEHIKLQLYSETKHNTKKHN